MALEIEISDFSFVRRDLTDSPHNQDTKE